MQYKLISPFLKSGGLRDEDNTNKRMNELAAQGWKVHSLSVGSCTVGSALNQQIGAVPFIMMVKED